MERPHPDPPPDEPAPGGGDPGAPGPHPDPPPEEQADETNKLGYRNVDEQEAYDESAGTQGSGAAEPTARHDELT